MREQELKAHSIDGGTGESTEFTRQLDNRIRVRRLLFGNVKGSQALFTLASPHPTYQDR